MILEFIVVMIFITIFLISILGCCLCVSFCGLAHAVKNLVRPLFLAVVSNDDDHVGHQRTGINTVCYICIDNIHDEVIATCNHSYCAECILRLINHNRFAPVDCPACRRRILVLFRKFPTVDDRQKNLKQQIMRYNARNSEQPPFFRGIRQFWNILRQSSVFFNERGINYLFESTEVRTILILLVYIFSPIDIIPQAALGAIGFIDDAAIGMVLMRNVSNLIVNFVRIQARQQERRQ